MLHRNGDTVTVIEDHVVVEGVVMNYSIIVCERQHGELRVEFPHVRTCLDDRRNTMFKLALVENHGVVEDRETTCRLGLTKRRTTSGVSFGWLGPEKREFVVFAGVSAASVFCSPLPRYGRALP